jgi:hypothetical protein
MIGAKNSLFAKLGNSGRKCLIRPHPGAGFGGLATTFGEFAVFLVTGNFAGNVG